MENSLKRSANDFGNISGIGSTSPGLAKKHKRLSSDGHDNDISTESMDENSEVFMPQVSMETPRYDLSTIKRESPATLRSFLPPHFNFDYNGTYNKNADYSNDMHNNNDLEKLAAATANNGNGSGNHMDIPPGKLHCFSLR